MNSLSCFTCGFVCKRAFHCPWISVVRNNMWHGDSERRHSKLAVSWYQSHHEEEGRERGQQRLVMDVDRGCPGETCFFLICFFFWTSRERRSSRRDSHFIEYGSPSWPKKYVQQSTRKQIRLAILHDWRENRAPGNRDIRVCSEGLLGLVFSCLGRRPGKHVSSNHSNFGTHAV